MTVFEVNRSNIWESRTMRLGSLNQRWRGFTAGLKVVGAGSHWNRRWREASPPVRGMNRRWCPLSPFTAGSCLEPAVKRGLHHRFMYRTGGEGGYIFPPSSSPWPSPFLPWLAPFFHHFYGRFSPNFTWRHPFLEECTPLRCSKVGNYHPIQFLTRLIG